MYEMKSCFKKLLFDKAKSVKAIESLCPVSLPNHKAIIEVTYSEMGKANT
jgi:hypothetical protein